MYGYFLKSSKLSLWPLVIMRILPQSLRAPSSREQVQDRLFLRMHWRFHVVSSPLEELALCFLLFWMMMVVMSGDEPWSSLVF